MITLTVLRMRARRGLEWLTTEAPKLDLDVDVKRINWEELDMRENRRCVLGQAVFVADSMWSDGFSETFAAVAESMNDAADEAVSEWLEWHGFDFVEFAVDENAETWDRLRKVWVELAIEEKLYERPKARA